MDVRGRNLGRVIPAIETYLMVPIPVFHLHRLDARSDGRAVSWWRHWVASTDRAAPSQGDMG